MISKSLGGNPYMRLHGKYMYFTTVKWTSSQPSFNVDAPPVNLNNTEVNIFIPLSLMLANESYTAMGVLPCGGEVPLFGVSILP